MTTENYNYQAGVTATKRARSFSKNLESCSYTHSSKKSFNSFKLPPYGKQLLARLRYQNPPTLCAVCLGVQAWSNAKKWNDTRNSSCALVCPDAHPAAYQWPVAGLRCVIETDESVCNNLITLLAGALFRDGAKLCIVRPLHRSWARVWPRPKGAGE